MNQRESEFLDVAGVLGFYQLSTGFLPSCAGWARTALGARHTGTSSVQLRAHMLDLAGPPRMPVALLQNR